MPESPLTSLLNRQKRTNTIILALIAITALGILTIHLLLFLTNRNIDQINTQIEDTATKITAINNNREFNQYKKNNAFLASHSAINYSEYFQAVFDALGDKAALKSIQTQVKSEDPSNSSVNLLIAAESAPSFVDISSLIVSFKKNTKQFITPDFTSVSFTRNDQGKDIFTFPITLSLNTNHANNSSK